MLCHLALCNILAQSNRPNWVFPIVKNISRIPRDHSEVTILALDGRFKTDGCVSLLDDPIWASISNIIFAIMLFISLQSTEQVMHPASPIFGSDAWRIQLFFLALIALTLLAAWQLARWWRSRDQAVEPLTR